MAVMSIRIDDNKRKALKIIASVEGKSMGAIVSDLIGKYLNEKKEKRKKYPEYDEFSQLMILAEASFSEWDNDEDEVYNDL